MKQQNDAARDLWSQIFERWKSNARPSQEKRALVHQRDGCHPFSDHRRSGMSASDGDSEEIT